MTRYGAAEGLGPVARKLVNTDKWTGLYPAHISFSKELDALLHFADLNGHYPIRNLQDEAW